MNHDSIAHLHICVYIHSRQIVQLIKCRRVNTNAIAEKKEYFYSTKRKKNVSVKYSIRRLFEFKMPKTRRFYSHCKKYVELWSRMFCYSFTRSKI